MPKTTQWKPRRIRSEEERRSGSSQFINVDEGKNFLGYFLGSADPKEDDPAYYEFLLHWVGPQGKGTSVPCPGDDCPLCEDGDRPKTRAYSLWLVTQDEDKTKLDPPQLRIFEMNFNVIKIFTEWRAEGDKVKGVMYRVSKLDDRGNWNITPKSEKLTAAQIKEALKDPNAPDFDAMITTKLRKAMEGLAVARALDDDDEPEEPEEDEAPKGKATGKPKAAPAKSTGKKALKEWPNELDEETVTVESVDDDGNYFVATAEGYKGSKNIYTTEGIDFDLTDLSEGDLVTVTTGELDDDGDYVLSAEPDTGGAGGGSDDDEPADAGDLPDEIEDTEFVVTEVDSTEQVIHVKNDEMEFILYFLDSGPASEVDFDDYEEGMTIIVSAEKDAQGDMVATEVPQKKKTTGRKKAPATAGKGK